MKRKLALLLAVAMTLALLPTSTLFATSSNSLMHGTGSISEKTLLTEWGMLPNYPGSFTSGPVSTLGALPSTPSEVFVWGNLSMAQLKIYDNNDVKWVQGAPYLKIEPKNLITAGSEIKVTLDGAEWFFRDDWATSSTRVDASSMEKLKISNPDATLKGALGNSPTYLDLYRLFNGNPPDVDRTASTSGFGGLGSGLGFSAFSGLKGLLAADTESTSGGSLSNGASIESVYNWLLTKLNLPSNETGDTTVGGGTDGVGGGPRKILTLTSLKSFVAEAMKPNRGNSPDSYKNDQALQVVGSAYNAFNLAKTYREKLYANENTGGTPASSANSVAAGKVVATYSGNTYSRYRTGKSFTDDGASDANLIYKMTISADKKSATVTFPNDISLDSLSSTTEGGPRPKSYVDPFAATLDGEKFIYIPIVARTTASEDDVTITVNGNNTSISGGTYTLGGATTDGTYAYVDDPKTARDEFPINMLLIKENKAGSMSNGVFEISAPNGYSFNENALTDIELIAENFGYTDVRQKLTKGTPGGTNGDYAIWFKNTRGEDDFSVIQIELRTMQTYRSNVTGIPGTLILKDENLNNDTSHRDTHFMLYADESAKFDTDVNLTIRPVSGKTGITRQTDVKAGTRKDWTIKFETIGDIPTLINGRYFEDDAADADDDTHLAATVLFQENVPNAWWSGRVTQFVLPEGVKVRKAEFHDTENLMATYEDALESDPYMNKNKRERYVTVNGNEMTLSGIEVVDINTTEKRKKAKLEIDLWLSIESGYEGDITLTATGSGVPEEIDPIVIAKAISPISLKTEVTPVRIGYQYFQVGNITIQENVAGALEKNKQVWITVTDRINMDMYFTPGYAVEKTEGNISFKDRGIAGGTTIEIDRSKTTLRNSAGASNLGGGTIVLDIDSASSVASTLVLSNLQLKIDRSVPESSIGYEVYVWGPNVAPNSDVFDYSKLTVGGTTSALIDPVYVNNDLHNALGIHTKYVEVSTPATATSGDSVLSAVVKVTAASGSAYRDGNQVTIDPAPFIDGNSRMQVPVRALANLLGVTAEQIIWSNADRTVTINMPSRIIQFAIGSDIMLVNGAQVRMDTTATIAEANGRTFVPFRALGEALGVQVSWDDATKTATYNSDKE